MWRYCPFTVFGPVIEPRNRNAFLSENPIKMLQNKRVRNLPWMAGVVQTEGLYPGAGSYKYFSPPIHLSTFLNFWVFASDIISKDAYLTELNDRWYEIAPNLLQYNFSVPEYMKDSASSMIKHFYFGDEKFSRRNIDTLIQVCAFKTKIRLNNNNHFRQVFSHYRCSAIDYITTILHIRWNFTRQQFKQTTCTATISFTEGRLAFILIIPSTIFTIMVSYRLSDHV